MTNEIINTCYYASYIVDKTPEWVDSVKKLSDTNDSNNRLIINLWLWLLYNYEIKINLKNYRKLDKPNICHFVYNKKIYISFSGTKESMEYWRIFKSRLVWSDRLNCHMHLGFLELFNKIVDEVLDLYKYYYDTTKYELVITGHTIGGAIAKLVAFYLNRRYKNFFIQCVTFGAPKIGNKHFNRTFNIFVPKHISIILKNDFIPSLPFSLVNKEKNTYTYCGHHLVKYRYKCKCIFKSLFKLNFYKERLAAYYDYHYKSYY